MLALDAIRALQFVGRVSEVSTLARLSRPSNSAAVQAAATEALAAVHRRMTDENERNTLVRGSSPAPGEILRAAYNPVENFEELLIAIGGDLTD